MGSINKDFLDKIYLTLPSRANIFEGIHAELSDDEQTAASGLRKGQKIILSCEGSGKIVTDVVVKDCQIE